MLMAKSTSPEPAAHKGGGIYEKQALLGQVFFFITLQPRVE